MGRLQGRNIYLDTIEREQFKRFWESYEFDMSALTELPNVGLTLERADKVFDRLVVEQGKTSVELGIYTNGGLLVGDIVLQDIEWLNRSAGIGIEIPRIADRGKGYGSEAVALMLGYAFDALGLERVHANTLEHNAGCRKALEKNGFTQEGVNRRAVYIGGRYYDRILYSVLADEYRDFRLR